LWSTKLIKAASLCGATHPNIDAVQYANAPFRLRASTTNPPSQRFKDHDRWIPDDAVIEIIPIDEPDA
jgi:hypothetical protein